MLLVEEMKNIFLVATLLLVLTGCHTNKDNGNNGNVVPPNPDLSVPTNVYGIIESIDLKNYSVFIKGKSYSIGEVRYLQHYVDLHMLTQGVEVKLSYQNGYWVIELLPTLAGTVTARAEDSFVINNSRPMTFTELSTDIGIGDFVLVFMRAAGVEQSEIIAVIELNTANVDPNMVELNDNIQSIDPVAQTLRLSTNTVVDYSMVTLDNNAVAVGNWVKVIGSYVGDLLVATAISDNGVPTGMFEKQGVITSVQDKASTNPTFNLGFHHTYITDANTCYVVENGTHCDKSLLNLHLNQGARVKVRSTKVSGVYLADVVTFLDNTVPEYTGAVPVRCEGYLTSYNMEIGLIHMPMCIQTIDGADYNLADTALWFKSTTTLTGISAGALSLVPLKIYGERENDKNSADDIRPFYVMK